MEYVMRKKGENKYLCKHQIFFSFADFHLFLNFRSLETVQFYPFLLFRVLKFMSQIILSRLCECVQRLSDFLLLLRKMLSHPRMPSPKMNKTHKFSCKKKTKPDVP